MSNHVEHTKQTKMKHKKKFAFLLASLILVFTVGASNTLAYIIAETDALKNIFFPAQVSCAVEGNSAIKNTGDTEAYIRATVVVNWQNSAGHIYGKAPVEGEGKDYSLIIGEEWLQASDGYYYYKYAVSPNMSTAPLCELTSSNVITGYMLTTVVVAEAIQSKPAGAVDSWDNDKVDVTGNNAGTELTVANK
ncbi:MAG: hypothetical protein IJC12_06280 [Peptococcaceae bacterium]|nr:hypothetical protein [Peptococcaceae bacterium]